MSKPAQFAVAKSCAKAPGSSPSQMWRCPRQATLSESAISHVASVPISDGMPRSTTTTTLKQSDGQPRADVSRMTAGIGSPVWMSR